MGRLVYRPLRNLYPVIVAALVKAAEAPRAKPGTLATQRSAGGLHVLGQQA